MSLCRERTSSPSAQAEGRASPRGVTGTAQPQPLRQVGWGGATAPSSSPAHPFAMLSKQHGSGAAVPLTLGVSLHPGLCGRI